MRNLAALMAICGACAAIWSACSNTVALQEAPTTTEFVFATFKGSNQAFAAPFSSSNAGLVSPQLLTLSSATPQGFAVDTLSATAYVADAGSARVSVVSISSGGKLTEFETDSTETQPVAVALDTTSKYVYVVNKTSNSLSIFSKQSTGRLTAVGVATTGTAPASVATASGGYVYVANSTDGTITEYSTGSGGTLSQFGNVTTGVTPVALLVNASAGVLYSVNAGSNTVSVFEISPTTGALTVIDTLQTGSTPSAIALAVSQSSTLAFVTNQGENTVSMYTVGGSGDLTGAGKQSTASSPTSVVANASGTHLYVAGNGSNDIIVYDIIARPLRLAQIQDYITGAGTAPFALFTASLSAF